jgi:hypothetical protein
MKCIFILSLLCLPIFSFKPNFCVNCKYFITDGNTNKFSKCYLFPKEENNIYTLITGKTEDTELDYYFCSIARKNKDMCGLYGELYKSKKIV